MRVTALIVAGGVGRRFAVPGAVAAEPKQFALLAGRPILAHTLERFGRLERVDAIAIAAHPDYIDRVRAVAETFAARDKPATIVAGGATRQMSVFNGLESIEGSDGDIVAIHDAVRPLVTEAAVLESIDAADAHGAAIVVTPTTDTIVVDGGGFLASIPDRGALRNVQTPQTFRLGAIREAHRLAREKGLDDASDDAQLVLAMGRPVKLVEGPPTNIKITTTHDLKLAQILIDEEADSPGG